MSTLHQKIQDDMKEAMRAKDAFRLSTIRMLLAAIKQREIDARQDGEQVTSSDADILQVIHKMVKQRRESAKQFRDGHRPELAEKEEKEIAQLEQYLPKQFSSAEIETIVKEVMIATGASSIKDMGTVMNALKSKLQGKADMATVSSLVKSKLN